MPPEQGTEIDKFFDGLPSEETKKVDIFDGDKPAATPEEGEKPEAEKPEGEHKNRRHRRLEQNLQKERELRIAAEARAAAALEARVGTIDPNEVPKEWTMIYGDTPEARQAWALQKGILEGMLQKNREETMREIDAKRQTELRKEQEYDEFVTGELEAIEDEFNIDVTTDAPAAKKARKEFLEVVQELSPKDDSGEITGFADFGAAWKVYQDRKAAKAPSNSVNKDVSGRTIVRPAATAPVEGEQKRTPGFFGWQRDMGL